MTETFTATIDQQPVCGLRSEQVEVRVVPSSGGRVIALLDRVRARDWLWAAEPRRPLACPPPGTPFDDSPLIGIDECLPTVAPCALNGSAYPDHGEVWQRGWEFDDAAFENGAAISTAVTLASAPLRFERTITLADATVRFAYRLTATGPATVPYIWCQHPLFAPRPGDSLDVPGANELARVESATGLPGLARGQRVPWREPIPGADVTNLLADVATSSLKLFLATAGRPGFTCHNPDGTRLTGRCGPAELLPYLGLWISRGGWNGCTHVGLEPTNAEQDRLDHIPNTRATRIAAGRTREWWVELTLGA